MDVPRSRRSMLSEDVYGALIALIMDHALEPGARLNIDALARDLDVSPTPLREALARLESEGLVRRRPLLGYTVGPLLSRQEFMNMFEMRLVLECAAARWAAQRATADDRQALLEAAKAAPAVTDASWRSHAEFASSDARYHDRIAETAGNSLLREAITRLHAHLHIHRLFFPYGVANSAMEEHLRIAQAIDAGQPDLAESAMREHLIQARDRHLAVPRDGDV
ncbi:GntR family transcriptional regulator [Rhizocola hellebori]|uniref:GntR family transcriptional regulator n=1 Tax=Rhizocola hellebori TaxID=1392758 RepID=UPI0023B340C3|nr:GntR family transcriptional regulator [Rhizocola hellebori]